MNSIPTPIAEIADATGATILDCQSVPDGSGFATMALALPNDHWVYEADADGYPPRPHYPMRAGKDSKARDYLSRILTEYGGKYAVRTTTLCGRETDIDYDALVRNVEIGLFGVYTTDGLNSMGDGHLFDPVDTSSTLRTVLLEALALAVHDGLLSSDEVIRGVSAESISEACARHDERVAQREREYKELCIRKGWDPSGGEVTQKQGCPFCSAPEVDSNSPRTVYACGTSDYDQRPGTGERKCGLP